MKRFLKHSILFSSLILTALFVADYIVSYGLRKTRYKEYGEWNDIYSGKLNTNLIISGSSRAWVHISPQILDSLLPTSSYNIGIDAQVYDIIRTRQAVFLQRNPLPKTMIISLDIHSLTKKNDLYHYNQFCPYFFDPIIKESISQYDVFSTSDFYIPFIRYLRSEKIVPLGIQEFFSIHHINSNGRVKGYMGNPRKWDNSFDRFKTKNKDGKKFHIDSSQYEMLKNDIIAYKRKGIKVILVYTPEYWEIEKYILNRNEIISMYNQIATKNAIPFLNYSKHAICKKQSLFYNSQHLNKNGAEQFSCLLANDLKEFVK